MTSSAGEERVLSREELNALLEEMPKLWDEPGADKKSRSTGKRLSDIELERANESFASAQGLKLSNRYQRVISLNLIGHREIEMPELAELMLPTDLAASYRILPKAFDGFLLLSRPLFFQLLSMSFGAGPAIKGTRPPTRKYSRIERRFYESATRDMLRLVEAAWQDLMPLDLEWAGLATRSTLSQSEAAPATLATFDVKGFGESCRVRLAIPNECFSSGKDAGTSASPRLRAGPELSVDEVPLKLRAQVGFADMTLGEVGALKPGHVIELDTPSDGSLTIRIGDENKFTGVPGVRGPRRAVQLRERIDAAKERE